jgi:hypothetical protein
VDGGADLISQIILQFRAIYLAVVASNFVVGEFNAAFKIIILFLIFNRVFLAIFYPIISRCFYDSPKQLSAVFNNVLKMVSVFSFYVGLCAIMSANFLIRTIFSLNYNLPNISSIFHLYNDKFSVHIYSNRNGERTCLYEINDGWNDCLCDESFSGGNIPRDLRGCICYCFLYYNFINLMAVNLKKWISFSLTKTMLLPSPLRIVNILLLNNFIIMPLPLKLFVITILGLSLLAHYPSGKRELIQLIQHDNKKNLPPISDTFNNGYDPKKLRKFNWHMFICDFENYVRKMRR